MMHCAYPKSDNSEYHDKYILKVESKINMVHYVPIYPEIAMYSFKLEYTIPELVMLKSVVVKLVN